MRTALPIIAIATTLAGLTVHAGAAEPDRDSLIAAWEQHMASLPGTVAFEGIGEGSYRLNDTDLPYEGELRVVGALVRGAESPGFETDFTHFGMVDMELVDLPAERLASQSYYYWLSDRQSLHYSATEQDWVSAAAYQAAVTEQYSPAVSYGALNFMLNYGIWIALLALVVYVFVMAGRQGKKARALMHDTEAINQKASDNLDRSERMQDEVLAITREMRDLQTENNALLRRMTDALERRN